jgi:hypothetical protein
MMYGELRIGDRLSPRNVLILIGRSMVPLLIEATARRSKQDLVCDGVVEPQLLFGEFIKRDV